MPNGDEYDGDWKNGYKEGKGVKLKKKLLQILDEIQ